jgi:cytochrome P450
MTQTGHGAEAGGLLPPLQIRRDGFDPTPELGEVRASTGLRTVLNVFGAPVHLITRYDDVKAVLSDHERFSNAPPAGFVMPGAPPPSAEEAPDPRAGNLLGLDPPEHQRLRRMLTGEFTARRINRLQPRIAEIVKQQLDDMEMQSAPTDLVSTFALPIPSLVICELLGVPYDDREGFQRRSDRQLDVSLPFAERYELEQPSRAPRLATWILKAAGGQALRDRNAKDAGADYD